MKAYKNYIIAIVILLIIYLILALPPLFVKRDMPERIFPNLDKSNITKFIIEPPASRTKQKSVTLLSKGGKWYVSINGHNYNIDSVKQDKIINAVLDLISVRIVTKNMKEISQYHLDEKNVYELSIYVKDQLYSIISIGKNTRDFRSTFFKLGDENLVRVSPESLISYVRGQAKDWMDHTIFKIDIPSIDNIGLPKVKIYKKNSDWHFKDTDKLKVDTAKITGYLNIFSNFRTNDFELSKTKKECGLDKPEPLITISGPHNVYEIFKGNSDKKITYILVKINHNELPVIYKFYNNRLSGLLKEPKNFVLEEKGHKLLDKK
ncbi:DUF4340 domain-containing protein [bacterium]|nr:DUF4340 domain-containing protein [bacterium]